MGVEEGRRKNRPEVRREIRLQNPYHPRHFTPKFGSCDAPGRRRGQAEQPADTCRRRRCTFGGGKVGQTKFKRFGGRPISTHLVCVPAWAVAGDLIFDLLCPASPATLLSPVVFFSGLARGLCIDHVWAAVRSLGNQLFVRSRPSVRALATTTAGMSRVALGRDPEARVGSPVVPRRGSERHGTCGSHPPPQPGGGRRRLAHGRLRSSPLISRRLWPRSHDGRCRPLGR